MSRWLSSWPWFGLVSVTVIASPNFTYEPFDNIKLLVLGITAAFAFAEFLASQQIRLKFSMNWYVIPLIFLFALVNPLMFSDAPFSQQIYGAAGRSLGFFHYFFLFCIFLGMVASKGILKPINFFKVLIATGLFEAVYSLMQYLSIDPIIWDNSNDWIFGTFGNPNFLSAFLGLSACASLFPRRFQFTRNWCYLSYINVTVSIFVIIISGSIQGLFIFCLGFSLHIIYLIFHRSKVLGVSTSIFSLILATFISLGVLGKGVMAKFVYQDSTTFRGDYWRAGFRMFKDNLLTGVGLDSYGDNYRLYRDAVAANRRGLDLYSNSAHNIFIDLASTGGIFLLLTYIAFVLFIFVSGYSKLKKSNFNNQSLVILIILWLGFQAQLLISINVSSVAIWGFAIAGLIVREDASMDDIPTVRVRSKKSRVSQLDNRTVVYLGIFLPLFVAIVFPLFLRDVQLANAISSSSKDKLIAATTSWPQSCYYLAKTEEALTQVEDFQNSLAVSQKSVSLNNKCFDSWRHIYENPVSSENFKIDAWKKMLELDPNLRTN